VKNHLVSIITPSYNQAAFLECTIQSVLRQDYPDIEYIIVDGGSTDGSVEIIHKYADRLAWWVSERDRGQAEAINKGMQRASGEIVAWLNSDDMYLPGAVAGAMAVFAQNPALGLVFGDALTIDGEGRLLNTLTFGNWGLEDLLRFRILCQPAVFMRRELFMQAGMMNEDYHFMLDHHLWLRIARLAPMQYVRQLWAAARHHAGAKNNAQAVGFAQETARALAWLETDANYAALVQVQRRFVLAGAYRLQARYYLEGGDGKKALQYYLKTFQYRPRYTLQYSHRILYAFLSLFKRQYLLDGLNQQRMELNSHLANWRARAWLEKCGMMEWEGLRFSDG